MRPWLGEEEQAAAAEAIGSGWVAQGPRVTAFEDAVCERVGSSHAVAVSSCTAALHLALKLLGVGPDDEVVVPSLSFIATANSVRYVGAAPVFADVEESTQNLSAKTVEHLLTPATRAVIAVHQCGVPADIAALHQLCVPLGVAVVEDAACAIGSTYAGSPIGSHSELVAFSFHPRKIITTGEGGMLVTRNREWAERARRLREHGMSASAADRHRAGTPVIERYLETGFNYRMTDIQAAVGLVQLGRLTDIVSRRRHLGQRYQDLLAGIEGLTTVGDPPYGTTNYQSFWVVLPEGGSRRRSEVMATMAAAGVVTRRGIMAAHLEPAFAEQPHTPLPVTDRMTRDSLLLPLYHEMTEADQDRVVEVLDEALAPVIR